MCSIIGFFNFDDNIQNTTKALKKFSCRGDDAFGIYDGKNIIIKNNISELENIVKNNNNISNTFNNNKTNNKYNNNNYSFCLGHNLFSIVNFAPQPLKNKGTLVANCEIYNWEYLSNKYNLKTNSDSDLLLKLLDKINIEDKTQVENLLKELDGPYAFAYLNNNKLLLVRDNIGIKPLCIYNDEKKFAFASQFEVLPKNSFELNPREYLIYDVKVNKTKFVKKKYFTTTPQINGEYENIKKEIKKLFINSIKKRIPKDKKVGVLFSGGVDSTLIALTLKELNIDFTCYTANFIGGNITDGEDLKAAKQIAKEQDLNLKIAQLKIDDMPIYTKKVMKIIQSKEYVKVSVAIPLFIALESAKKDNVKVIFSGIGSEELFADYQRYRQAEDINKICLEGLKSLYLRDLYRDDVISMYNNIELRVPFLDNELINYATKVSPKHKIDKSLNRNKIILRDILKDMNLSNNMAERPKKAAQYGTKSDRLLFKLAKQQKIKKQEYLNSL
ncbi:MAG: DUF7411 family protein [Nanoarchaeota archaeon]